MKNSTKHTPGPWEFGQVGKLGTWVRPSNERASFGDIALIHDQVTSAGSPERSQEIAFADAQLIAAAPDLAKALRALYDFERYDDDDSRLIDARVLAQAALAKAGL